jgi:hypothetical protein
VGVVALVLAVLGLGTVLVMVGPMVMGLATRFGGDVAVTDDALGEQDPRQYPQQAAP